MSKRYLGRIFVKNLPLGIKKYLVLGVLFLLPITAYVFFASGENNFGILPVLTSNVSELNEFEDLNGASVGLKDHITILCFFGNDLESKKANAFNLAHKIYKKNYQFEDFQFVILLTDGQQTMARELTKKLAEIENPLNWKFTFGSKEAIQKVFNSLSTNYNLEADLSSPYVFIIDREGNLRGRDDDEDVGILYGFDARNYSEINNKMGDDVKIILAEYRRAMKKYNKTRDEKLKKE